MLVLLSFGLVLVATVLLVLGLLVGDGLTLIYVSIALSAAAAVILFIAVRVSKPKTSPITAPTPLVPEPQYATVGGPPSADATATLPTGPPSAAAAPPPPPPPPTAEGGTEWLAADQEWEAPTADWEDDELEFPIADYDELTSAEILPLLPQLYTDELDVVEARERQGQNRAEIVGELQRLRTAGAASDDEVFPIEDYDELTPDEVAGLLGELDSEELATVRAYEAANEQRAALLDDIDRRLGRPRKKAPAKKKAAPAKKAPAKKAAAPARRAPAKKAPAKKAAAPAKKAPAKKAAAPAKKAPAKKAAAPAKKAAAKKKAAGPAKKAAKRR